MALLKVLLSGHRSCIQFTWKEFYNEYIVNYILRLLNNEHLKVIEFSKMFRPRFQYRYDNRRVPQRMPPPSLLQVPYVFSSTQFQPIGGNQHPGNYGMQQTQTAPPYRIPIQHPPDVREVIRQDILNQIKPGGSTVSHTERQHPVSSNREGRKRHFVNHIEELPKRAKTDEPAHAQETTLASELQRKPVLYESVKPSHNDIITQQIIEYYIKNHQTDEMYRKKVMLRDALFAMIQGTFPNSGLYIVGSSMSGFGTMKSDMDLCLMISREKITKFNSSATLNLIKRSLNICKFVRRPTLIYAKVPILRFEDSISGIECDININNENGIRNTHLLKYYCLLDWRVRILVLYVKHWASFQNINSAKNMTISSYNLSLMIIHYLQTCKPPVLPSLQILYPNIFHKKTDVSKLRLDHKIEFKSENTDTVGDLFSGFLKYYTEEFDFENDAISVRLGVVIPKKQMMIQSSMDNLKSWSNPLCIEEPFELFNAARSCFDNTVFTRVRRVFKQSHKLLSKGGHPNDLFKNVF